MPGDIRPEGLPAASVPSGHDGACDRTRPSTLFATLVDAGTSHRGCFQYAGVGGMAPTYGISFPWFSLASECDAAIRRRALPASRARATLAGPVRALPRRPFAEAMPHASPHAQARQP